MTNQELRLEAVNGCNIHLIFGSFRTESGLDYVEMIYEWNGMEWNNEKFSGDSIPGPFTSSGNTMTVRFHTDGSTRYRGFSAVWTEMRSVNTESK